MIEAQLLKLAVLFTCDRARTTADPSILIAEYRGRDHVAAVAIDEREPISVTDIQAIAVVDVIDWCYARLGGEDAEPDWLADRLLFMQTRVAQYLEPYPSSERLRVLVRSMPDLLEGVAWQWKAFIQGKVGAYLDQEQQVETAISETVGKFADQTAKLIKSLSDTILAAVAVIIGSFVAAAFATPFNAALFRVGVLIYAVYVLVFPGFIGLAASLGERRGARAEFDIRMTRFAASLYREKVVEIVGTRVEVAQQRYNRWLTIVAVFYVAIAILSVIAAGLVPGVVALPAPAPAA